MHCFIYFVFLSIIHLGLCLDSASIDLIVEENKDSHADHISPLLPIITATIIEPIDEDIIDNITELTTTTIINEKQVKPFLTKYALNINQSSSDIIFNNYLNDSILLIIEEREIFLINKKDGTTKKYFKYGNIIPTKQSNFLVIYDDHTQELWIINSTHEQNSIISFKPKQIHIFPSRNNLWVSETSDELYISKNTGITWTKIDDSSSSTILGWSNKANSAVIIQHSHYIKLLDLITYQIRPILNDVSSAKLFTNYLFTKRLNSISVSHVNNLADDGFRSLPKRLQSQGNFYCAIEDINTQDLLLLFVNENRLGENNETSFSTCNLISYSKENLFYLLNINCGLIQNDNTIECQKEQIPFYQVRGLSKSVYLANVGPEPTTRVSFDDGVTWNKTSYECDKMMFCPNNLSIVINSLISSNDAPGILLGKASDGINEYVAISTNGGRLWRLNFKGKEYLTAISNPNALIVTIRNNKQQSLNHSFRYSTDYGRNWHRKSFSNETSFQILSLIADKKNIFYILTSNNENVLNLIQLDFNLLIREQCARYQLKEWSLHNACIDGSKLYYKRRISGSHCLDELSEVRSESCACSLTDFECLPGYKRSKDGICLPRSHYIFSQDCIFSDNNTLQTKSRGYVKSENSQCLNGIENYLSNTFIIRHDPNHPNFFLYGIDSRTKRATVEIHTNDFDRNDDDEEEEDENEDLTQNTIWSVDQTYEITALAFNKNGKQVYMAVEHDQLAIIYRIDKNFRQQNRYRKQMTFDSNSELYKSFDERIEYLTIDWLTQNLYVLLRNKTNLQQTIFILDVRTHKRRAIVKNQQIQPPILIIDPIKTDLYWISRDSPSVFNIGNLQGQIKKQIQLTPTDSHVSYLSYDPITHEIIYVINSNIYGLNTLDHDHLSPRIIYEHSSVIQNALFVHPILYFTNENNATDSSTKIYLHAIDILVKSFAKNITRFKDFNSLKLFINMAPVMPTTTIINRCANNPCSDICIPLEHERFRCLCSDDARYQSCSCPTDERLIAGSCQAKNGQCAPGRVLCQNLLNCAESARICEQDHTQYTEAFKTTARCTFNKLNDGFNCYYTGTGLNNTCIPFEWLCDGEYDCPLGNDEVHCNKLTTTIKPATKIPKRCSTDKKFTHVLCDYKCMRITDVCRNISNLLSCTNEFHLNCQQTNDKNQYVCKCRDDQKRCIAMIEQCEDFESCEKICNDSIHYANSKTNPFNKHSSTIWIILIIAILAILVITIIIMTLRYTRRRKNAKNTSAPSRTPATAETITDVPPSEKLLNNGSNIADETS